MLLGRNDPPALVMAYWQRSGGYYYYRFNDTYRMHYYPFGVVFQTF